MKLDVNTRQNLSYTFQVPVAELANNRTSIGHMADNSYHERFYQLGELFEPFHNATTKGCFINGITLGSQTLSELIMDTSRTLLNGTRLVSRFHSMDNVFIKLAILFLLHLLFRRNFPLELHLLSTALLHWEVSSATITPTPSYTIQSTPHWITPALNSSFQSIGSGSQLFRTFNTTILASKTDASPKTAYFQINAPVTATKLEHLQGTCDDEWIHDGDLCYRIVTETRKFNYAERFCVINSAHLISISSQEENDKILNLVSRHFGQPGQRRIWLGLERLASDSQLHWVDGTPLTYENWAPGEPDRTGACAHMIHKGWWEDTSCSQKLPYICKKNSRGSLPYSRATELGILIGIPVACSAIMLSVVAFLFVKSIQDSEGTYYAYGKYRDKDKIHSCLVNMTASIAHVGAVGYVSERRFTVSSMKSISSTRSGDVTPGHSRANSLVEPPEITITPETPEQNRRFDARVFASSSTSIEQDRFQSATSLENLLSKKYIKSKIRRMRSLKKAEAVVSPAGAVGKYTRKDKHVQPDLSDFIEI